MMLVVCVCFRHEQERNDKNGEEILAGLRSALGTDNVVRFNISRARVWEGAKRAFLRSTYSAYARMSVKFMDDLGVAEGAVDEGGPRRELLQLLMEYLATSPLFVGPAKAKHLSCNSTG
jgi:hypothetical protein